MRILALLLCLLTFPCFSESETELPFIWEDDAHFCYYRTLQIEGSLYEIRKTALFAEEYKDNPEAVAQLSKRVISLAENALNALGYQDYQSASPELLTK